MDRTIGRRRRRWVLAAGFAAFTLLSLGCAEEPAAPDAGESLAATIVADLSQGRLGNVVETLHYPPNQSPEVRSADKRSTEWTLGAILEEFGAFSDAAPAPELPPSLQLTVASGDDAYWKT